MAEQCEHFYSVDCHVKNVFSGFVGAGTDAVVDSWAGAVLKGLDRTLISVGTFWVNVDTPDVTSPGSVTTWAQSVTSWLVLAVGAISFIFACGMLVWHQRGETLKGIASGMFTLLFVSAGATLIAQLVITISDKTATWLIERATDTVDGSFSARLLAISAIDPGVTTMIVVILLGLAGVIANLFQMGLMYVRSAMLILLLALIPVAAAASMLDWGREWFKKMVAWFFSFALSKPAAALVYGVGIKLVTDHSGDSLEGFVLGVITMVLAPFSLPALIKFITPAASVGGGGGGAGAAAAATGALATGAIASTELFSSGSALELGQGDSQPQAAAASGAGEPVAASGADDAAGGSGLSSQGMPLGSAGAEGGLGQAGAGAAWGASGSQAAAGQAASAGAAASTAGMSMFVEVGGKALQAVGSASQAAAGSATGADPEVQV